MEKGCIRAAVAAGAVLWMAFMPSLGAAQDIRLMSYNILHGKGADGQVDIPRIANVISREKPDYVGLQEVDRGVSRSHGIDEPAELGRLTGAASTDARCCRAKCRSQWTRSSWTALGVRAIRETLDPNDLEVYFQCLRKGGGKPVPYQVPRSVIP